MVPHVIPPYGHGERREYRKDSNPPKSWLPYGYSIILKNDAIKLIVKLTIVDRDYRDYSH